jgi:hypothetical protein
MRSVPLHSIKDTLNSAKFCLEFISGDVIPLYTSEIQIYESVTL